MRLRIPLIFLASSALAACFDTYPILLVRATAVTFAAHPSSLVVGDTVRLAATPLGPSGQRLNRPVAYASTDVRRATVSPHGVVTGVSSGTVWIAARSDGGEAQIRLVVQPAPPSSP